MSRSVRFRVRLGVRTGDYDLAWQRLVSGLMIALAAYSVGASAAPTEPRRPTAQESTDSSGLARSAEELAKKGAGTALPTPQGDPVLTAVTANVPFTLSAAHARAQIAHVLGSRPDVVVLNEVKARDVAALADSIQPGIWTTYQPPGAQAATAVLWRSERFTALQRGVQPGSVSASGDSKYLPWALLQDRVSGRKLTVIGLHFPTNSSKLAHMRARYLTMNAALGELVRGLGISGVPMIAGGDWNHPLRTTRESWSPVPTLRGLGLTTNWRRGLPCSGTSKFNGQIDGFALTPSIDVLDQGCLARAYSDHRPVWMRIDFGD